VTKNVFNAAPASLTYGVSADTEILCLLNDEETAIGCCPTGFECDSLWAMSCSSTAANGEVITGVSYGRSCSSTPVAYSVTTSSDIFNSGYSPTAQQLNAWIVCNPEKDNSTSLSSGGLSIGAKIGLGVGIPLGVIAIAAIIFAFCIRHRRLEKERLQQQERKGEKPVAEPVLPPHLSKLELQGSDVAAVTSAGGQALHNKPELDIKTATSTAVRSEEPKSPGAG
jgi:hypothetical protein